MEALRVGYVDNFCSKYVYNSNNNYYYFILFLVNLNTSGNLIFY